MHDNHLALPRGQGPNRCPKVEKHRRESFDSWVRSEGMRHSRVPLAAPGLSAAAALSFARGLGEFGATLFFAGSLQGVTQTLPLAIYAELDVSFDTALAISALLIVISACVLLLVKLLPLWKRSDSQSTFPVVPSA